MKKIIGIAILILITICQSQAQIDVPWFGKINWVNGFAKEITGENLSYFSAYPDYATVSLLTRATDGNKVIEWETAPVPEDAKGPYVYFSWVAAHSSGTSNGERNFDLYINDEKVLTFTTYPAHQHPNWIFKAPDSTALIFQQTKRDGANDAHGLAYLRLPLSRVKPGKPVRLKIVGQAQNSNDWYMTFKFSFEEKVDVEPMPFLLKNGKQPAVLTALHFGKPSPFNVTVNNNEKYTFTVQNGVNNFDIPLEAVKHKDSVMIKVMVGEKLLLNKFVQLQPVTYRELNLIHHSHTDIGYSHLQTEVLKIHNKNIVDALQMIEATKEYPEGSRFKWNIESIWAVENWMKWATPQQKETFIKAVKEGNIGLSALYANILTGLSEPEETFHYTDYAQKLNKEYGLNLKSAMISDIPGYAWTTITALAHGGVRYFSSGPNYMGETHPFMGDRVGHFVRNWADKPVWWLSPSGEEKILFWTAGKGYSSWHGTAPGGVFDRGPKKIATYLNELDEKKYPYDIVQWRYNIVADNGPIDSTISRFVKEWNEKYKSPKLVLNTTEKLFEEFEQKYGDQLPVVKGDITPYWEDGAISTAAEEGKNRLNSLRLQQLETLYSIVNPKKYKEQQFYEAWRNIIMFHEHTWGAYNSTSEPDLHFVQEQWRIKKQFMLDGDTEVKTIEQEILEPITNPASKRIAVFNTSSWKRSGLVTLPASIKGNSVKNASGNLQPLQHLNNGAIMFMATDIPALGYAVFEISDARPTLLKSMFTNNDSSTSNGIVTVVWDKSNGSIINIHTEDKFNYAGAFNNEGLNSYWYVPGLNPAEATTNNSVHIKFVEGGQFKSTVSIVSEAPGANKLERRISLVAGSKEVFIENIVDKKPVRTKESVHFGFPFNPALNKTTFDAGYGTMTYLVDQLKGSNADYLYGRRWMDVSSGSKGIQMIFMEAPLLEPETMIDEQLTVNSSLKQWKKEGTPTSTWFSYAMDNYWHTNYKADQEGVAHFKYCLRLHDAIENDKMEIAAEEFTQPLIPIPIIDTNMISKSLFELTNTRIIVTSVTPQEYGGFIIRLFNTDAQMQKTGIIWKSLQPYKMVIRKTGEELDKSGKISMAPMGVSEYLLK